MKTAYEVCIDEFRDASAALRVTFAALSEAREAQILANRGHAAASDAYDAAKARLEAADAALQAVRAEPPAPADIDTTAKPANLGNPATFGTPFNQMFNGGRDKRELLTAAFDASEI